MKIYDLFSLTQHVNATAVSNICIGDERKKFNGPNAHALRIISTMK